MKKGRLLGFLLVCFSFFICFIPSRSVRAANPTTVTLKEGKTYTAYDITGDQKKDTILITKSGGSSDYYKNAAIYINGVKAYSFSNDYFYGITAKLYTLKNGTPFLYFYAVADNYDGPVCSLFQYKSGKLKSVINFQTLVKKYGSHQYGRVLSVNGNSIKANFFVMSWSLGVSYIDYTYSYKSGTLKRTSNTGTYSAIWSMGKKINTFTANKSLTVYKKAGSSQKYFTLKKGDNVKIRKCWVSGKKMYLQVVYNGKTGWIKAASKFPWPESRQQFSNVMYAG